MNLLAGNEKDFFEYIGRLDEKDRVAVLCHNDLDGVASAVIISKVVGKIDFIEILSYSPEMLKPFIKKLKQNKINKLILTDLSVESEEKDLQEISKFAEILIIDHHPLIKDLNNGRIVFVKAAPDCPASYMCYYLFSKMQNIPAWIAVLGTLADRSFLYNKETAEKIFDEFKFGMDRINLWDSMINFGHALVYFRKNEKKAFDILNQAKRVEDLEKFKKYSLIIQKEIDNYINDFDDRKEIHGNLIIYEFNPKYSISSILSNILSVKYKNKVFIFIVARDIAKISARNQSREVNLPELLNKSLKGIPNSKAGGHFSASGAQLPKEYLKDFKKVLVQEYNKLNRNGN